MATTVNFGWGGRRFVGNHTVYLKQRWRDDWVSYATDLHCTEAVWCAAPSMPTATLSWKYGIIKQISDRVFLPYTPMDVERYYVKVVFISNTLSGDTMTWYGVVSDVQNRNDGYITWGGSKFAQGEQTLFCYGMEKLLEADDITDSMVYTTSDEPLVVRQAVKFNRDGIGNRSELDDKGGSYLFDGIAFNPARTYRPEPDSWSTRDIVKYLLKQQSPSAKTASRVVDVPFDLKHPERLDNSDKPVVEQENYTVLSLLQQLIDRRRLRSFRVYVEEKDDEDDVVWIDPFTLTADEIDFELADVDNILPNESVKNLIYDHDELTHAAVRTVDVHKYDQIIVRGRRRVSVATLRADGSELEEAWSTTQESAYEAAASGVTGYATWDDLKKHTRNAEVRSQSDLQAVYSWFRLATDWDFNHHPDTSDFPCFVQDDGLTLETQYLYELLFDPLLPMWENVDYSGTNIADDDLDTPREYIQRQPFCMFKRPTDDRWVHGEKIGTAIEGECELDDGINTRWSATVRTQPRGRVAEIHVNGEPQHVLANTDFTPLADDRDLGEFDYTSGNFLVTLAIVENRRAEGRYPDDGEPDRSWLDAMRQKVIFAGDAYRQDYVAAQTVVDIDADGAIVKSGGGLINDDTERLGVIARIAYEWYGRERSVLALKTLRFTNDIIIGDMIGTVGDPTLVDGNGNASPHYKEINSTVTEIRIANPRIPHGQIREPEMTVLTSAGEMDFMSVVPPIRRRARGSRR